MSERQKTAFETALRRAAQHAWSSELFFRKLASIGESLFCYVPRLLRDFDLGHLATLSYADITSHYEEGSWAIDDLIRLLERIADEAGVFENEATAEPAIIRTDGNSAVVSAFVHSVPSGHVDEPGAAIPLVPATRSDEPLDSEPREIASTQGCRFSETDADMQSAFDLLRQVLQIHTSNPLLDEELREFLEPSDSELPTKFLGNSVREVLETPFVRLSRSWLGRGRVDCLLKLLDRAVTSIYLSTAERYEGWTAAETFQRPRNDVAPRELHADEMSWRTWSSAIHLAGLHRLKLGTVVECLRDVSTGLWDQPLAAFTSVSLAGIAGMAGVGPSRFEAVVSAIRGLAVELLALPHGTSIRLKFIAGPLRGTQDWIEQILENRLVPELNDLTIHLLRPLAGQLKHDLNEREAQIAISRLRLEDSPSRPTLDELAVFHGVTRERIRQLEQWGPRVLRIRFPQGRYLLDALYGQLSGVPGAEPQAKFVRSIATLCFESEIAPLITSEEVAVAWDEAGRLKLTPMTIEQIMEWSRNRLPKFAPNAVLEAIRSRSLCLQIDSRPALWFSQTEIDRILYTLSQQRGPVRLGELVLLDKIQNDSALTNIDRTDDFTADDERSLWGRIRRDPRFVECGDHHLLMSSDECGVERLDGQWMIRLIVEDKANGQSHRRLSIVALGRLITNGLSERGIFDATVWGVHRFASELIAEKFRARFIEAVTPAVLADILVKVSDGVIRTMRRRRLRWDKKPFDVFVRGKRGWVGHVVTECGHPMLLNELASQLRDHYQDYADYVVNQLTTITNEEGEIDDRAQFVTGLGHQIPIVVMPTNWTLDINNPQVSTGVNQVVRGLASQVQSERLRLEDLDSASWLRVLVERQLSSNEDLSGDEKADIPLAIRGSTKHPIKVTRVGNSPMPLRSPIQAFIVVHGTRRDGTVQRQEKPERCDHCWVTINVGESFVVENTDQSGSEQLRFPIDDAVKRWCLKCIEYDPATEPSMEFSARTPDSQTQQLHRSASDLSKLHSSSDASRILSADLKQPVDDLLGYAFGRILACAPTHRPWSLAELSLCAGDIDWLKGLFERATAAALRQALSGPSRFKEYSREAQLGAVLLLLESELARRHASEGQLWSAIHHQVSWHEDTSRFLFNDRQPNARHKAWLEVATKELGLRSAFGEDSAQEWYQSVFLQCGFSKKSFENRLPEWLGGQSALVSVHLLAAV